MNDENWRIEFKQWKPNLRPIEVKLLEEGPQNQNQACILNEMWCEWKDIAVKRKISQIAKKNCEIADPWESNFSDSIENYL